MRSNVHPFAETVLIKLEANYMSETQEPTSNPSPTISPKMSRKMPLTLDKRFEKATDAKELRRKQEEKNEKMDQNDAALDHLSRYTDNKIRCCNLLRKSQHQKSCRISPCKLPGFSPQATPHHDDSGIQFCWDIRHFFQAKQQAVARPNIPFVSPTWLCPRGYCLRAYLFLNGYRDFSESHVSVFVSVVQGPHDDCLKWPAAGTISIVLLDRKHNNHKRWCNTYCLGRNFLRPPKEVSDVVAAGCYDFLPIAKLDGYIEDDTMLWEFNFNKYI
jgi:hypothetical protein